MQAVGALDFDARLDMSDSTEYLVYLAVLGNIVLIEPPSVPSGDIALELAVYYDTVRAYDSIWLHSQLRLGVGTLARGVTLEAVANFLGHIRATLRVLGSDVR